MCETTKMGDAPSSAFFEAEQNELCKSELREG